ITTRSSRTPFEMSVSPDGTALFLASEGQGIDAVSVRTGRLVNSTPLSGWPMIAVNVPAVIGFTTNGSGAYMQWWARELNMSGVVLWPWRNGGPTPSLVDTPGFT